MAFQKRYDSHISFNRDNYEQKLPLEYFVGKGPKSYRRSDERIQEEVWTLLMAEQDLDLSEIEIDVKEGEVTLMGTLPDRRMKYRLEDKVAQCAGVRDVVNNIHVLKKFRDIALAERRDRRR